MCLTTKAGQVAQHIYRLVLRRWLQALLNRLKFVCAGHLLQVSQGSRIEETKWRILLHRNQSNYDKYIHYQRISIIKFIHYYIIVNGYFGRYSNDLNSVERVYHFTLIFAITKSNEIGSRRLGVCKLYSFTIIDKSLWVQEHKTVHLDFFWNIYFQNII